MYMKMRRCEVSARKEEVDMLKGKDTRTAIKTLIIM
jgi:hypothetical protein